MEILSKMFLLNLINSRFVEFFITLFNIFGQIMSQPSGAFIWSTDWFYKIFKALSKVINYIS